jgi:hypothetical protein
MSGNRRKGNKREYRDREDRGDDGGARTVPDQETVWNRIKEERRRGCYGGGSVPEFVWSESKQEDQSDDGAFGLPPTRWRTFSSEEPVSEGGASFPPSSTSGMAADELDKQFYLTEDEMNERLAISAAYRCKSAASTDVPDRQSCLTNNDNDVKLGVRCRSTASKPPPALRRAAPEIKEDPNSEGSIKEEPESDEQSNELHVRQFAHDGSIKRDSKKEKARSLAGGVQSEGYATRQSELSHERVGLLKNTLTRVRGIAAENQRLGIPHITRPADSRGSSLVRVAQPKAISRSRSRKRRSKSRSKPKRRHSFRSSGSRPKRRRGRAPSPDRGRYRDTHPFIRFGNPPETN